VCANCSPRHCTNVASTCSPKMIPFRVWLPYSALNLRALESCGLRWPCAVPLRLAVSEGPGSFSGPFVVVSSSDSDSVSESESSSLASGVCLGDRRTTRSSRCRLVSPPAFRVLFASRPRPLLRLARACLASSHGSSWQCPQSLNRHTSGVNMPALPAAAWRPGGGPGDSENRSCDLSCQ
jgi:hypothetical protein